MVNKVERFIKIIRLLIFLISYVPVIILVWSGINYVRNYSTEVKWVEGHYATGIISDRSNVFLEEEYEYYVKGHNKIIHHNSRFFTYTIQYFAFFINIILIIFISNFFFKNVADDFFTFVYILFPNIILSIISTVGLIVLLKLDYL